MLLYTDASERSGKMTDSEMIDMFIKGDKNTFGLLYDKYVNQAVRTAYLITNNSQLSRDIAQETFVKCYLGLNNLKNKEAFKSWFFKILVRTAWEMDNKNKASVPVSEIYDMADKAVYDSDRSDFELLYKAVNALNQKQKTAVVLFYFNDMSLAEISKVTGELVPTVKSRLFFARKAIKKYIELSAEKGGVIDEKF